MSAVMKGGNWSDPNAWADGTIPKSSNGLQVQLYGNSTITQPPGSALPSPFLMNDVIAESKGLSLTVGGGNPYNAIPGSLDAHDIQGVDSVVQLFGSLDVRHDLTDVNKLSFFSGTAEIGHDLGSTTIYVSETPFAPSLILDHPARDSLNNQISLGRNFIAHWFPTLSIELGGITFDHADLIPPVPGSTNERVQLTNQGNLVYELNHVEKVGSVAFGGVDPSTGYDTIILNRSGWSG